MPHMMIGEVPKASTNDLKIRAVLSITWNQEWRKIENHDLKITTKD